MAKMRAIRSAFWLLGCVLLPLVCSVCSATQNSSFYGVPLGSSSQVPATREFPASLQLSQNGTIFAVDGFGNVRWSFYLGAPLGPTFTTPIVWSPEHFAKENVKEELENLIKKSPVISEDGVWLGNSVKTVFAVDPLTGKLLYKFQGNGSMPGSNGPVESSEMSFLVRTDHSLQCFDLSTGSLKWKVEFSDVKSLSFADIARLTQNMEASNTSVALMERKDGVQDNIRTATFIFSTNNAKTLSPAEVLKPSVELRVRYGGQFLAFVAVTGMLVLLLVLKGYVRKEKPRPQVLVQEEQQQQVAAKEKRRRRKGPKNPPLDEQDAAQVDGETTVGRLRFRISDTLGVGSGGTTVYAGFLEGRAVAIKRILTSERNKAQTEVDALIKLDQHSNVVRYYAMEQDRHFTYIALERCMLSMEALICRNTELAQNFLEEEKIELWENGRGFPTPRLLGLLRNVVEGIAHLHHCGYLHRDLKPQNVLICYNGQLLTAKVADMGLSKRLLDEAHSFTDCGSAGWRPAEQIQPGKALTSAADMFSLGCLLFFCITGGGHPFGPEIARELNITRGEMDLFAIDHFPEAVCLISSLVDIDPAKRLSAKQVRIHPFFWNSKKRLAFLIAASDRVEHEDREVNSVVLPALEGVAERVFGGLWNDKLDNMLLNDLGRFRSYKFQSLRDLLRVIRNKSNHYHELSSGLQETLGPRPDGYENYFKARFPRLLLEVYHVLKQHCSTEAAFREYFDEDFEDHH